MKNLSHISGKKPARIKHRSLRFLTIGAILIAGFSLDSCSRNKDYQKSDEVSESEIDSTDYVTPSQPEAMTGLQHLAEAIKSGDSRRFAHECSYPIRRPYPLRDINDSAEMEEYYPIIIDDSIRKLISVANMGNWHPVGWRGWMLDEGNMWWDGKLYSINYESKAERSLRHKLAAEETNSLHSELREGYRPFFCIISENDGTIYRIDVTSDSVSTGNEVTLGDEDTEAETMAHYRLAEYSRKSDLRQRPDKIMHGTLTIEGSVGSRILSFSDGKGTSAVIMLDPADDDTPSIEIIVPGDTVIKPINRIYWRDYLALPR